MRASSGAGVLVIIAIVLALLIVMPMLIIWALNVLFPILAIPLTIKTWFAIVILAATIFAKGNNSKS